MIQYRKNELVTVEIEDIGRDGEGIGKADGFPLFVKDAIVGDIVEARIVKAKKNYAYARLEKVVVPSPFRVQPKCRYHRQCGGCQLQALSYEKQLEFKQKKIMDSLVRIGGFGRESVEAWMEPILGMEKPFHYRNKAQYPVGTDRGGRIITGFYAGRTHNIIANTDCRLGAEENQMILNCILTYMRRNGVSAYDEESGTGLVRHILIRKGHVSGEIMVCLVINKKMTYMSHKEKRRDIGLRNTAGEENSGEANWLPEQEELLRELAEIEGMTSISVSINTDKTNVIMGTEIHTLWGRDTISDTIRARDMTQPRYPFSGTELTFSISPLSFYQVNPEQTEKLYSLALEYAGLTGGETVWDLYCGIGTISLFLAGSAGKVYGIEVVPQAILDARENARRNGVENAVFSVGKAEEVLRKYFRDGSRPEAGGPVGNGGDRGEAGDKQCASEENLQLPVPDVIVVDPPRKGCDADCLEVMLKAKPERIVYVSCDPATLARDLRVLCDGGYEVKRVRGVDQFGMTVHVETVCLLSNRKSKPDTHVKLSLSMDDYYRIKEEGKNNQ